MSTTVTVTSPNAYINLLSYWTSYPPPLAFGASLTSANLTSRLTAAGLSTVGAVFLYPASLNHSLGQMVDLICTDVGESITVTADAPSTEAAMAALLAP